MMVVGECETYSFAQMTRALQYENNGAKALGTDRDWWESMWVKVNLMHEFKSTFLNTWFLVWTKYCLSIYSRQMINEAKIVPSELKLITITCALWVLALMATARRDRTHCTLTTHRRSSALFSGRCIPMHVGEAQCIRSLYVCARCTCAVNTNVYARVDAFVSALRCVRTEYSWVSVWPPKTRKSDKFYSGQSVMHRISTSYITLPCSALPMLHATYIHKAWITQWWNELWCSRTGE